MKNLTHKLAFIFTFLLAARLGVGQIFPQRIGIIGSATANGWNASTNMTLAYTGTTYQWSLDLPLQVGEVKFRANDMWDVNWGGAAFPSGTATPNGPTTRITAAGNYNVQFDDGTAAYRFTLLGPLASQAAGSLPGRTPLSASLVPNPASEAVQVRYELPAAATVTLVLHNLLGQVVTQFPSAWQPAGLQEQLLRLPAVAAGYYMLQVQAGAHTQMVRLQVK